MPMTDTHGNRVKASILAHGLMLWPNVTARGVGKACKLTHSAVLYHYGSVEALRAAVAAEAVRSGDRRVVPLLIVSGHPAAAALSETQRREYLAGC